MNKIVEFIKRNSKDVVLLIVLSIGAFIITKNIAILDIKGDSMFPTYSDGEMLILKKESEVKTKDTVVFTPPNSWGVPNKNFVKRVIAQEGDTVRYKDNKISVNNESQKELERDYCSIDDFEIKLEKHEYFMLGDNIQNSNDSLTQMCIGNEEFLIKEENILISGHKLFSFGGF